MSLTNPWRIGYVVKRYPRYSETFIVNEILAHEAAGVELDIFALHTSNDTHFQDTIAQVRASVTYLLADSLKAADFWSALEATSVILPDLWQGLAEARGEDPRFIYQAVRLAQMVRLKGITHLHAHFATSATAVARLAARFAGVPYTFTAHAKDIFHNSVEPDDLRRKLAEAATVITVSDYNVQYLREHYDAAAHRVQRVYNGLDLARFPFASPADRPPLIVAVGRLIEKKGFGDLIEACAILVKRGLNFQCQIIGTGELEATLRDQIKQLGLQDAVQLLGPRPQREISEHVQNAALFAAPCVIGADGNRDGLPTVLLEAMALGTPCVSTDVTGIPEVLRHNETGLMVPQHNPAALAEAMHQLLTGADRRVQLATKARQLIETEFDVQCNAARLREIFGAAERPAREPVLEVV